MRELRIDPEFEGIIPALTPEEFGQLEENILAEGTILTAIIVWNDVIIDGHNRYRIAQKHPHISFNVYEKAFADRYEAMAWICLNQLGRRNLTERQKKILIGKRYIAKRQTLGGDRKSDEARKSNPQSEDLIFPKDDTTAKAIAREVGVGHATVERAAQMVEGLEIAERIEPGIMTEVIQGTIKPTNQALIDIGKAPPEVRPRMVEKLRKKKPPTPKKSDPSSIAEITAISGDMGAVKRGVTEDDILVSLEGAVETMLDTCSNYFQRHPKLLSDPDYRAKVIAVLGSAKQFINEIEGGSTV